MKRGEERRADIPLTLRHTRRASAWQPELVSEISADNNLDVQIAELFVMFVS